MSPYDPNGAVILRHQAPPPRLWEATHPPVNHQLHRMPTDSPARQENEEADTLVLLVYANVKLFLLDK